MNKESVLKIINYIAEIDKNKEVKISATVKTIGKITDSGISPFNDHLLDDSYLTDGWREMINTIQVNSFSLNEKLRSKIDPNTPEDTTIKIIIPT